MNAPDPGPALPAGWWQRVRHDLRSAVAPVRMAVQVLRSGRADPVEREEALEVIDRQLGELLLSIEDVSDLLKVQAGLSLLQHDEHDANLLLDVVCGRGGLLRGLAQRDLRIHCEPCANELRWRHDPARIAALIEFLLLRLAAHAAPGSELRLSMRHADGQAELRMSGAGAELAKDPELAFLLGETAAHADPSLRSLLMREVMRGNSIGLHRAGEGALSLRLGEIAA